MDPEDDSETIEQDNEFLEGDAVEVVQLDDEEAMFEGLVPDTIHNAPIDVKPQGGGWGWADPGEFDIFSKVWVKFPTPGQLVNVKFPPLAEMPTSGDLKSGEFSFITPQHRTNPSPKKKVMTPPPHQIDLHTPKST